MFKRKAAEKDRDPQAGSGLPVPDGAAPPQATPAAAGDGERSERPAEGTVAQEPAAGGTAPEAPAAKDQTPPAPDYYAQLLMLKAEFENYRKRVDREKPGYVQWGKEKVLDRFLSVYDLLLKVHEELQASQADTPLAKGMEGIFKEFEKIFKEEGVEVMAPLGKPYDAMLHEVLGSVETDEREEGVVVDVVQAGFSLGGRALRPARVRIARKPANPAEKRGISREEGPSPAEPGRSATT